MRKSSWLAVAAALLAGLLTLVSMTKIWNEAFWKDAPSTGPVPRPVADLWVMVAPIAVLAVLTVVIGCAPQPLFEIADRVASELLDLGGYVAMVGSPGGAR